MWIIEKPTRIVLKMAMHYGHRGFGRHNRPYKGEKRGRMKP